MKKLVLFSFAVMVCVSAFAQLHPEHKRTNVWYFGMDAGIDFNNNQMTILTNGYQYFDGMHSVSTISDTAGNLLITACKSGIYNRLLQRMDNGYTGCCFNATGSGLLLLPKPNNDSIFYFITAPMQNEHDGILRYKRINLNLDNGLGDVDSTSQPLMYNCTGSVAAFYHSNGSNIWFVSMDKDGVLKSFLLSENGISQQPECTYTLQSSLKSLKNIDIYGALLKASPNPDSYMLAISQHELAGEYSMLSLVLFDNRHGCFSNEIVLGLDTINDNDTGYFYAIPAFSPSGKHLYFSYMESTIFSRRGYVLRCRNIEDVAAGGNIVIDTIHFFSKAPYGIQSTPLGTMLVSGVRHTSPWNLNPTHLSEILYPDSLYPQLLPYNISLNGKLGGGAGLINTIETWFYRPFGTGFNTTETEKHVLYPNPTTGKVYVLSNNMLKSEVKVTNMLGKTIIVTNAANNEIDLSNLNKGIYLIELKSENGQIFQQKIVKL